jgi:hypothetical protein
MFTLKTLVRTIIALLTRSRSAQALDAIELTRAHNDNQPNTKTVVVTILLLATLLALTMPTNAAHAASPQTHTYNKSFDQVWIACIQTASEKYAITHSEKASGIISFQQGFSWKSDSWGTDVSVLVLKLDDNQTSVTVHPQRRNFQLDSNIGHITKTYFKVLDTNLARYDLGMVDPDPSSTIACLQMQIEVP